jgi:RHS repeat-associated protein
MTADSREFYDNLSRLREARYNPGVNVDAADGDLLRRYQYTFDLAGNRTQQIVSVAGTPTTTNYSYNGANQLTGDGTYTYEYDGNGNLRYKKLTGTPVEEYTWNRANRLVTWDNGTPADLLNYSYDGLNNRISRSLGTTSPTVTKYLLDLQPGLSVVLAATEDTDVTRYVHGPMGIHAQEDPAGAWSWMTQDGLGSVRGVLDNSVALDEIHLYDPFGNQVTGSPYDYAATVYGFTGEPTETVNPLVHLRARDYNSALGVFTALDPFAGRNCLWRSVFR